MAKSLRIAVVGSGAIGCYYGGKLAAGGHDVQFLMRSGLEEVRRDGLRLIGPAEDLRIPRVNCFSSTVEIGPCDLVLIALKTTTNELLADLLPPLLHEQTMVMTLQNGFGNEDLLAQNFGEDRVLGGLCFICLIRTMPGRVERYDDGHIVIAEYQRRPQIRTQQLGELFRASGIRTEIAQNLILERWRKLVWNVPFNGLSILAGGIDTAAILADDALKQATLELMEEVIAGATRCGYPLEKGDAAEQIRRTEAMGRYKPSTLLDYEAGRALEIEAIWGEPLRRAVAAGVGMPRLQLLYATLRSLDRLEQLKKPRP